MTATIAPPLEVEGLTKHFPAGNGLLRGRSYVHAVDDVSFALRPGTITALVGESGSGKSTVARMLARLYEPTAGRVVFEGKDIAGEGHRAVHRYRAQVQMIFQDPFGSLNPVKTVRHHIARPLRIHGRVGRGDINTRVNELLETVGLTPGEKYAVKYPHELSGGQRQRVAIARALAVEPTVLLADEPTSMLDVSIRVGVLNLMLDLKERERLAFLYVTHDLASARYVADTVLVMYAGQIVEQGPAERVLQNPLHPYTRLLLASVPDPSATDRTPIEIRKGHASAAVDPPPAAGSWSAAPCGSASAARSPPSSSRRGQCRAPAATSPHPPLRSERTPMSSQLTRTFPSDFVWGAATASYQIEGAANEDGRGESVWDRFCATPGKVRNGESGAIACDFYHRYRDDIALMGELGLDAFRFSIAWPRVLPNGRGAVNAAGLDFYDRLVDELLGNGIAPYVTLFHWDTPQVLEDAGGWPVRDTVDAFVEYVTAVAERLGDRVGHWITHNEPWVVSWVGHGWGHHAPGRMSDADALATAHHLLLSHGRAVEILRELSPKSQVGITLNLDNPYAASESAEDIAAARWVDGLHNRWFLDPLFHSAYPDDMAEAWAEIMPDVRDGDLATISTPIDFLGVNNYTSPLVAADENGGRSQIVRRSDVDRTDMGWEVVPEGSRSAVPTTTTSSSTIRTSPRTISASRAARTARSSPRTSAASTASTSTARASPPRKSRSTRATSSRSARRCCACARPRTRCRPRRRCCAACRTGRRRSSASPACSRWPRSICG